MPLQGFLSQCEEYQSIVVSKDSGGRQKHIGRNTAKDHVTHYQIDGVVITTGQKCDFLLINENKKTVYFIELKGSDIRKAIEQLKDTRKALSNQLCTYTTFLYRIVTNRCSTHSINSSSVNKFKIECTKALAGKSQPEALKIKTTLIDEPI